MYAHFRMPRVPTYNVHEYSYYHINQKETNKFGQWLKEIEWSLVYNTESIGNKTEHLHHILEQGMAASYQWKNRKKKTSEPCWMTDRLRNMIEDRRKMFRTAGFRSEA